MLEEECRLEEEEREENKKVSEHAILLYTHVYAYICYV